MVQNFINSSYWSLVKEESPQETLGLEKVPSYFNFDIREAEIGELRERIKRLEERLEQKLEQQIIPVQFLESKKLKLNNPIYVTLSYNHEDKFWIVDCPELNVYGSGKDETEAIKDFKIVLEEKYFDLKQDRDKLGPELQQEWLIFDRIIKEK